VIQIDLYISLARAVLMHSSVSFDWDVPEKRMHRFNISSFGFQVPS